MNIRSSILSLMAGCFLTRYGSMSVAWLLASIPVLNAVSCFSGLYGGRTEDCGPNGFCYLHNSTDGFKAYTIRGCDHSFVCEIMINKMLGGTTGQIMKSLHCTDDAKLRLSNEMILVGKLCCCAEDWCNTNYEGELRSDLDLLQTLNHGTWEDYERLVTIAKKHNIE